MTSPFPETKTGLRFGLAALALTGCLAAILAAPLLELGYGGNAALFFLVQISTTAGISAMLRWNGFRLALASAPPQTGIHQPAAEPNRNGPSESCGEMRPALWRARESVLSAGRAEYVG